MESKKKFKFNALDAVIIIVLIACVAGIAVRFDLKNKISKDKDVATITVSATYLRTGTIDNGQTLKVGDEFVCDKFGGKFGTVTAVEYSPAVQYHTDDNGKMIKSNLDTKDAQGVPMRSDVVITLSMTGRFDEDGGFLADGINRISPNANYEIYSKERYLYITVLTVDKAE